MRLALGADHAGVALKAAVTRWLDGQQVEYRDFGTFDEQSVDYPDIAAAVAAAVSGGAADRGLLICGSGVGMAIAANKIDGVRAACVVDPDTARLCREHNDANVLTLGARVTPFDRAIEIITTFLATPFAGGRHERRVQKIAALERQERDTPSSAARH